MVSIELLVQHEETIAQLYEAYGAIFPEFKTFWATLSYEEKDHAKKIRELIEERRHGRVTFDSTKYDPKAINTSIKYVSREITKAETSRIKLVTAFSIAMDIEKAIIDGKVFEAFKGHTKETRALIRELTKSVTDHYQTIERTWAENRHHT